MKYIDPANITSTATITKAARAILMTKFDNDDIGIELFSKAMDQLERIEKGGGEGSRGGHIIGHTRSGKAIYFNSEHKDHKHFTSQDHKDASAVHRSMADSHYSQRQSGKNREHHNIMVAHHTVNSYKHDDLSEAKAIKSGTKVTVKNTKRTGTAHYQNYEGHYVKFDDGSDGYFQEHDLDKN